MGTHANKDIALLLELAEAEWNSAKLSSFQAHNSNSRGVDITQFGGIQAMASKSLASNPSYNRAFCIAENNADYLNDAIAWLLKRNASIWVDIAPPLSGSRILQILSASPLHPVRFCNIVFANLSDLTVKYKSDAIVEIAENPNHFMDFADILSSSFGIPTKRVADTAEFNRIVYSGHDWKALIAYVKETPVAIGTMHVGRYAASITTMGKSPTYRNMGYQKAVIDRCITLADESGAELITSQVSPGQISEANFTKMGFEVAYTKCLWGNQDPIPIW